MITTGTALAAPLRPGRDLGPHHAVTRSCGRDRLRDNGSAGAMTGRVGYRNLPNSARPALIPTDSAATAAATGTETTLFGAVQIVDKVRTSDCRHERDGMDSSSSAT